MMHNARPDQRTRKERKMLLKSVIYQGIPTLTDTIKKGRLKFIGNCGWSKDKLLRRYIWWEHIHERLSYARPQKKVCWP